MPGGIGASKRRLRRQSTLTSAICKTPVVAHRAEILKDKDGHSRNYKQHHEHHHPHISTEWLCGRKMHPGLRQKSNWVRIDHSYMCLGKASL